MKSFKDFSKEVGALDGDKIKLDEILNYEVIITGYSIKNSKYGKNKSGKYLTIQVEFEKNKKIIFTGSDVLIDQFERYGDEIPFTTIFKKIDRYYTLS